MHSSGEYGPYASCQQTTFSYHPDNETGQGDNPSTFSLQSVNLKTQESNGGDLWTTRQNLHSANPPPNYMSKASAKQGRGKCWGVARGEQAPWEHQCCTAQLLTGAGWSAGAAGALGKPCCLTSSIPAASPCSITLLLPPQHSPCCHPPLRCLRVGYFRNCTHPPPKKKNYSTLLRLLMDLNNDF